METLILNSKSSSDLQLLAELAKKLGISVKYFTEEEMEDMGMLHFLNEADRDEVVSKDLVNQQTTIKPDIKAALDEALENSSKRNVISEEDAKYRTQEKFPTL
jgi:hypothetical protein